MSGIVTNVGPADKLAAFAQMMAMSTEGTERMLLLMICEDCSLIAMIRLALVVEQGEVPRAKRLHELRMHRQELRLRICEFYDDDNLPIDLSQWTRIVYEQDQSAGWERLWNQAVEADLYEGPTEYVPI